MLIISFTTMKNTKDMGTIIQGIKFYTVAEVSEIIGVTNQTTRKYVKEGRLKGKRVGRPILIAEEDLNAFLLK